MNSKIYIKLFIGVLLFVTWVVLVVFKVPDTQDIIASIKLALLGLGVYHLGDRNESASGRGLLNTIPAPPPPEYYETLSRQRGIGAGVPNSQGGFAAPGLLLVLAITALMLAGCAVAPTQPSTPQTTYTQACAAYGAAFAGALQLRQAGRLNRAQIDQVTLLDSQVTPICTGALPADPAMSTQQITAAVTALTILELARPEN